MAGILIDLDHPLDYYIEKRQISFEIKKIYLWTLEERFEFIILCFHSLELLFLLWVVISLFRLGIFWVAFAIGITQHMVLDLVFNRDMRPLAYFLSFRIIKKFRKKEIMR